MMTETDFVKICTPSQITLFRIPSRNVLCVNLGVQIWLDGPGFGVRSNYESTDSSMNQPYVTNKFLTVGIKSAVNSTCADKVYYTRPPINTPLGSSIVLFFLLEEVIEERQVVALQ